LRDQPERAAGNVHIRIVAIQNVEQVRELGLISEPHTFAELKGLACRLKQLLALESYCEIVGEVGDGREVLHKVQQANPDILLLDLRMPNLDGLAILEARSNSVQA
jgi:CheY-like chemotaxis protein